MDGRDDYARKKRSLSFELERLLGRKLSALQLRVYYEILPAVTGLDIESGRLVFSVRNLTAIGQARKVIDAFVSSEGSAIGRWIGAKMGALLRLNRLYYKTFIDEPLEAVTEKVTTNTLLRLGYNATDDILIQGGYLANIFGNTPIGSQVASAMNRSLAGRMGLQEFRQNFKALFVNPSGNGLIESHFKRATFDIFQQTDRSISKEYADELGLNYARYSGTIKDTTRPFCKARLGKVFTREEIQSWKNLNFQGKPKNYIPEIDLGGYNCRHSLDWISDELAQRFIKEDQ